jgi:threonine/homoserine/homoserine lactone efflux protein
MTFNIWLLFCTTTFFVSATPGPNMLLAMTHGIHYGLVRTLPTCAGLMTGLGLIMLGSVAGLGALLSTSETLFSAVKFLGAAYLVYLGIKTWRARPVSPADRSQSSTHRAASRFRTGFMVSMSNPKAFIFFTALFPQFMNMHRPQMPQLAILAATFYLIEASWQFTYACSGVKLSGWLGTERHMRTLNRLSGGAFMGAGVLLSSISRH